MDEKRILFRGHGYGQMDATTSERTLRLHINEVQGLLHR